MTMKKIFKLFFMFTLMGVVPSSAAAVDKFAVFRITSNDDNITDEVFASLKAKLAQDQEVEEDQYLIIQEKDLLGKANELKNVKSQEIYESLESLLSHSYSPWGIRRIEINITKAWEYPTIDRNDTPLGELLGEASKSDLQDKFKYDIYVEKIKLSAFAYFLIGEGVFIVLGLLHTYMTGYFSVVEKGDKEEDDKEEGNKAKEDTKEEKETEDGDA